MGKVLDRTVFRKEMNDGNTPRHVTKHVPRTYLVLTDEALGDLNLSVGDTEAFMAQLIKAYGLPGKENNKPGVIHFLDSKACGFLKDSAIDLNRYCVLDKKKLDTELRLEDVSRKTISTYQIDKQLQEMLFHE